MTEDSSNSDISTQQRNILLTSSLSNYSNPFLNHSVPSVLGLPDIFSPPAGFNRSYSTTRGQVIEKLKIEPSEYICRICHGGTSAGDLLTPCRCKGSIALAHLSCLETWLGESNRNRCELCNYNYRVIREPRFSVPWSIFMFLRHPGDCWKDLLIDFTTLIIYTPSTITSTYMLMLLCENLARSQLRLESPLATHLLIFTSIFGIATINFTYTSWLAMTLEKYFEFWKRYYKKNCSLKIILSEDKIIHNPNRIETQSESFANSINYQE